MQKSIHTTLFFLLSLAFSVQAQHQITWKLGKGLQADPDIRSWRVSSEYQYQLSKHWLLGAEVGVLHGSAVPTSFTLNPNAIYLFEGKDIPRTLSTVRRETGADLPVHLDRGTHFVGDLSLGYQVAFSQRHKIQLLAGYTMAYTDKNIVISVGNLSGYGYVNSDPTLNNAPLYMPIYERYTQAGWNLKLNYQVTVGKNTVVGLQGEVQSLQRDILSSAGIMVGFALSK